MRVLGFVLRTAILWIISLVVAVAGMEAAHRFVVAQDRDRATATEPQVAELPAPD
jgi:hypothetical protein